MPLDETGFSVPSYDKLLAQAIIKTKQLFGDDWQTNANSPTGMWLRDINWHLSAIYQDVQDTFLAAFIDQATGNQLDQLGRNYDVSRTPATPAQTTLQFTGTPGYIIEQESDSNLFGTDDGLEFQLVEDVQLDSNGNGSGLAECTDIGADGNVGANKVTSFITQDANILTVNNASEAGGGADTETDDNYRQRIHLSQESQPGPTFVGLYTALYALPGVQQVQIVPNLSMNKDSYGNPPKSLHFYIRGGAQQEIGQTILNNIGAGIQTVGDIKVTGKDIGGHLHDMYYSEATIVPIYVNMTIKIDDDYDSTNGSDNIRQAIKDYLNSLIMGDKVVFTRLYQAIYNVSGVDYVNVTMGRGSSNMGTNNIQLDQFETATIAEDSDVEVTIDE